MAEADSRTSKKRARPRAARACEFCRIKKYRCDERDPCNRCEKRQIPCVYQNAEQLRQRISTSAHTKSQASSLPAFNNTEDAGIEDQLEPYTDEINDQTEIHPNNDAAHYGDQIIEVSVPDGDEVTEINTHTKSTEFYGPTSSLAFLSSINESEYGENGNLQHPSLLSTFHNNAFSPTQDNTGPAREDLLHHNRYYFRQAQTFLEGYFQTLHFIHPILRREQFLSRCENLWFDRTHKESLSFVSLYYSVLSLGALVREWDEDLIEGLGRFEWSRKFFQLATISLGSFRTTSDLDTIQALFFMAKVCQNELNPTLAYTYLGLAVRASLSAGLNRQTQTTSETEAERHTAYARTWWGLYSLEIEISFSLGRPDSLGFDDYHNRQLPNIDDTEVAIIPAMVHFARITRKVSLQVYLSKGSLREKLLAATALENEMENWILMLPDRIKPLNSETLSSAKQPRWTKRQRLVLELRYLNVQMVLHRPFLLYVARNPQKQRVDLGSAVRRSVSAARRTIEVMHKMFNNHSFFRTWWYNITYTIYAISIVLCYMRRIAAPTEISELAHLLDMSVEILTAMEDCVVATKAAKLVLQASEKVQSRMNGSHNTNIDNSFRQTRLSQLGAAFPIFSGQPDSASCGFSDNTDLDFMNTFLPSDDPELALWNGFTNFAFDNI